MVPDSTVHPPPKQWRFTRCQNSLFRLTPVHDVAFGYKWISTTSPLNSAAETSTSLFLPWRQLGHFSRLDRDPSPRAHGRPRTSHVQRHLRLDHLLLPDHPIYKLSPAAAAAKAGLLSSSSTLSTGILPEPEEDEDHKPLPFSTNKPPSSSTPPTTCLTSSPARPLLPHAGPLHPTNLTNPFAPAISSLRGCQTSTATSRN